VRHLAQATAPRQERHAPDAGRRIAQVRDRLLHLLDRFEPGHHDPGRAHVERPPDAQTLRRLGPHERRRAGGFEGMDRRDELGLGAEAVLEVDDRPVEPGPPHELRGRR
jgi:hypothetical protein